jgi:hypothetical protein
MGIAKRPMFPISRLPAVRNSSCNDKLTLISLYKLTQISPNTKVTAIVQRPIESDTYLSMEIARPLRVNKG